MAKRFLIETGETELCHVNAQAFELFNKAIKEMESKMSDHKRPEQLRQAHNKKMEDSNIVPFVLEDCCGGPDNFSDGEDGSDCHSDCSEEEGEPFPEWSEESEASDGEFEMDVDDESESEPRETEEFKALRGLDLARKHLTWRQRTMRPHTIDLVKKCVAVRLKVANIDEMLKDEQKQAAHAMNILPTEKHCEMCGSAKSRHRGCQSKICNHPLWKEVLAVSETGEKTDKVIEILRNAVTQHLWTVPEEDKAAAEVAEAKKASRERRKSKPACSVRCEPPDEKHPNSEEKDAPDQDDGLQVPHRAPRKNGKVCSRKKGGKKPQNRRKNRRSKAAVRSRGSSSRVPCKRLRV